MIHLWRRRRLFSFQDPPTPLSIYVQNSSIPLTLDVQFQTNRPPPPPNDNQSVKRKHNHMLSGPSFKLAFVFSINSLILPGFPLTSLHLAEASLTTFLWVYTLVCAVVQKYNKISFIYSYSYFWYSFCNQPVLF